MPLIWWILHCFGDIQPKAFREAEGAIFHCPATPTHFDSIQHFRNKQGSKDTFSSGISWLLGIVSRETENNKILPVTKFGIVLYILVFNMFCSIICLANLCKDSEFFQVLQLAIGIGQLVLNQKSLFPKTLEYFKVWCHIKQGIMVSY